MVLPPLAPDDLTDDVDGSRYRVGLVAPISPAVPAYPVHEDDEPGSLSIPLLPGERTQARRVKFLVANGCTVTSIMLGLTSVFLSLGGHLHWAAALLLACVVLDGLDGALARRFGVASPFGAQMDSMHDMSSFGVATPVLVFSWLHGAAPLWLLAPACALVGVCAAIRLARFNVSPKDGRYFCGVPTTIAAAIMAATVLVSPTVGGPLRIVVVAALALLMVSTFPYVKVAQLRRVPLWLWLLPTVGALVNYEVTFALMVVTYLASGPILWARKAN